MKLNEIKAKQHTRLTIVYDMGIANYSNLIGAYIQCHFDNLFHLNSYHISLFRYIFVHFYCYMEP